MYDYTKAEDLVKWAKEQYKQKNRYKNGGIGRYDKNGTRQFDCCGLFKCFMWHDYSTNNAKYYGKTQKDYNCEGLLAEAKEKGKINTIPEILGVLVYQKRHMGIYVGNGKVIESTAKKYDGRHGKIYKTYFKGSGIGCDGKRTTWTHWFKSPYLTYQLEPKPIVPEEDNFLPKRGYFKFGDISPKVDMIARFMLRMFPAYTSRKALGNYYGVHIRKSIKEFQKRTGLEPDGCIGSITLSKLKEFGFRY